MVINMDFKTLSGNEYIYLPENGIVITKRFKPLWRNRNLKEAARLFYKVFIPAQKNFLYPPGDITKKIGGVKMSSSTWCPAIRAGSDGGHTIPLSRCGGGRPRIPS